MSDDLLESKKSLVTHPLLNPFSNRRDVQHDHQRLILGAQLWKIQKDQVQTTASRSFVVLQRNYERELIRIVRNMGNDVLEAERLEANRKGDGAEFEILSFEESKVKARRVIIDYYKKAYMLGLKAAGAGISQGYNTFSKLSGSPFVYSSEESWTEASARREAKYFGNLLFQIKFKTKLKHTVINRIKMYVKALEAQYDAGRIAGSPNHSVVYWVKSKGHSTCPGCNYLSRNSPWPKELIVTTPKAGDCGCFTNCNCKVKIVPKTALIYQGYKRNFPAKEVIYRILKKFSGNRLL